MISLVPAVLLASLASALPQGLPISNPPLSSASPASTSDVWASASASAPSASASAAPPAVNGPYTGGDLTWYTPGEMGETACGRNYSDTDPIAALPQQFFDAYPGATANPNVSPLCGRRIIISAAPSPGAPIMNVTAIVEDICGTCNISTSVDVTPIIFTQVAPESVGRLHNISWDWVSDTNSTTSGNASVSALPGAPSGGPDMPLSVESTTSATAPVAGATGAGTQRRRTRRGAYTN